MIGNSANLSVEITGHAEVWHTTVLRPGINVDCLYKVRWTPVTRRDHVRVHSTVFKKFVSMTMAKTLGPRALREHK